MYVLGKVVGLTGFVTIHVFTRIASFCPVRGERNQMVNTKFTRPVNAMPMSTYYPRRPEVEAEMNRAGGRPSLSRKILFAFGFLCRSRVRPLIFLIALCGVGGGIRKIGGFDRRIAKIGQIFGW